MSYSFASHSRRGAAMVETALWVPILLALLYGIVEFGRVSYTYYTLNKILYAIARGAGTQTGANFCDDADPTVLAIKEFSLRAAGDAAATDRILPNLEPGQIAIRLERFNADSEQLEECDCSSSGCNVQAGGLAPTYIAVSIPDGYGVQLRFPAFVTDAIPLRPVVRVPYGGL